MFKRIFFLLNVLLFLLVTFPVLTQTRAGQPAETYWLGMYWNNTTLSGPPALQRQESALNFQWGDDAPASAVWPDHFSARWTRTVTLAAGAYRFTTTADDGLRLWLDDQLLIDDWADHSPHTVIVEKNVTAGAHLLTVEYYENDGQATVKVGWEPVPITNWRGEYFNNPWLEGDPALVRDDLAVDFDWGSNAPAPGVIGADGFAARWTRTLDLPAGHYRFAVTADDGVRLWVNGRLLVHVWQIQTATSHTADVDLGGGPVEIRLEYYENSGLAAARLTWAIVAQTTPAREPVTVDDQDPNFVRGGPAANWHTAAAGQGDHLTWAYTRQTAIADYNWVRWQPVLVPGRYEVFVYVPIGYGSTTNARYWVSHGGQYTLRQIDQAANGGRWVSLGVYDFTGAEADYLFLADITYETDGARLVAFDAAKWEPRSPPLSLSGRGAGGEGIVI